MKRACLLRFGIGAMLLGIVPTTHATTFCVNTASELRGALEVAESNGINDVIRMKTGTYIHDFQFTAVAFSYDTQEDFDITLPGRWSGLGDTCTRRGRNPAWTVLSGDGSKAVLWIAGANGSLGDIIVEQLTLRNGSVGAAGAGMQLGGNIGANGFNGDIVVERVYFDDNTSKYGAAGLFNQDQRWHPRAQQRFSRQ